MKKKTMTKNRTKKLYNLKVQLRLLEKLQLSHPQNNQQRCDPENKLY